MSRPTKEESIYKVSIHKNGWYMYAATHSYTIDENGNRKDVHYHWGVVDEKKKFIPGKHYVFANLEERERLIFPDDWDMSEAKRLSGAKQWVGRRQDGQTADSA